MKAAGLAAAVLLAVLLTHFQTLSLEFRADDYVELRPWTVDQVREAVTGSWSGSRAFQDQYHRPISGLYHAALFRIFGMNAPAMHALSLAELALLLWLLSRFLLRETGHIASLAGAAVYLVNPLLRDSTSAWIFNQFHLVSCLIVVATLLAWQRCRDRPTPAGWLPIFALAAAGWYVKEDTVMVLPAVLAAQALLSRGTDKPAPPLSLWFTAAVFLAMLIALRFQLVSPFQILPGRDPVPVKQMALSLVYGLGRPFFARAHDQFVPLGSALLVAFAVFGLIAVLRRRASPHARIVTLGAALLVAFALGLLLQPGLSTTRVHLVLLASSLVIAGGAMTAFDWVAARRNVWVSAVAAAAMLAGVASLHVAALGTQSSLYAPCSPAQLAADAAVMNWSSVSEDVRRWLPVKARQCAAGPAETIRRAMPVLRWRTRHGWTLLVSRRATRASWHLTEPGVTGPELVNVTVALHPSVSAWLRDGYLLEVASDSPTIDVLLRDAGEDGAQPVGRLR